MKRLVLTLFIALLIVFPIFTGDITATGFGNTINEAQENAKRSLAESIFPVLVSGTVSTSSSSSGKASFSSESYSQVVGLLTFIEYEEVVLTNQQKKTSKYGYKAILRDDSSTVQQYSNKAREAKQNTEYYYRKVPVGTINDKVENYKKTLSSYLEYSNYSTVLIKLGHSEDVPELEIDKTYAILQEEYSSALTEQKNELDSKESSYLNSQSSLAEQVRRETEELIKQNEKDLAELKAQKNDALLQEQMLWEAKVQEMMNSFIDASAGVSSFKNATGADYDDLCTLGDDVINAINNFNGICDDYEELIDSENKRIDKAITEESKAIRNRAYRTGQLSADGKPVAAAVSSREAEVEAMKKEKEEERAKNISYIESNFHPLIQTGYDLIVSRISKLEETKFSDSISAGNLTVSYNNYDANVFSWSLTLKHKKMTGLSTKLVLKYSDVTGESNPRSISDINYLNTVDTYVNLLRSGQFWNNYDMNLNYSIRVEKDGFHLKIDSVQMRPGFNGDKAYTVSFTSDYPYTLFINLGIRNVSSYKWLKTSSKLSSLYEKQADSSADSSDSNGINPLLSRMSATDSSKNGSSSTSWVDSFFSHLRARLNTGITIALNESSDSSKIGFILSGDLFYGFDVGAVSFGFGLSPYYWVVRDNIRLGGVDLLCVIDVGMKAIGLGKGTDDSSFYCDIRFGFEKGAIKLSTLVGIEFDIFTTGLGLIYTSSNKYDLGLLKITLSVGFEFENTYGG